MKGREVIVTVCLLVLAAADTTRSVTVPSVTEARPPVLGRHLLLDLQVSNSTLLNSIDALEAALLRGAEAGNLTVLDKTFHAFSPHGITGMLVLAESHMSIHTWPEFDFAALDIFVCGTSANPHAAAAAITAFLHADEVVQRAFDRGPGDEHHEGTLGRNGLARAPGVVAPAPMHDVVRAHEGAKGGPNSEL